MLNLLNMPLTGRIVTSNWRDLINVDLPPMRITEETRKATVTAAQSGRYAPVDARIAMGRFYTDREYEEMRCKEMSRPLP